MNVFVVIIYILPKKIHSGRLSKYEITILNLATIFNQRKKYVPYFSI